MKAPGDSQPALEDEPPCHVLLVEDDECTLRMVAAMLRHCDYKVTLARNGREALDVLENPEESEQIDLVLTDILMPEVSGMELISQVVRCGKFHDLPIIVMSSESREEVVSQALEAGAAEYLVKPVRRRELSNLWQRVQQPAHSTGSSAAAENVAAPFSWNPLPVESFARQVSQQLAESAEVPSVDLEIKPLDLSSDRRSLDQPPSARGAERMDEDMVMRSASQALSDFDANGLHSSLDKLHHDNASSAFSNFTSLVPRPCARGEDVPFSGASQEPESSASSVQATNAARAGWQAMMPFLVASSNAMNPHDQQQMQQQKFFDAFQAAVDQHTGLATNEGGRECATANRKAAIVKFREKRKARNFEKKVRYESRRRLAEARPRVRGQFVRADVAAAHADSLEGPEVLAT
ncbi:hypothetical protein WJX73_001520 [Symbiochloris irregularis]|uniref:Uncharacterized protein n=1 Tax=Symbiochloris irregularis TaxID=706552 RepID=A0AAW1P3S7_9CHLO